MIQEKNSKSESKEEQPKLDQKQYKFLERCSKKGPEGIEEWNKWRNENPDEEIWLQGAKLRKAKLQGADLQNAKLQGAKLALAKLQRALLWGAKLQGAYLRNAELQGAYLEDANLQGADLHKAKLQEAELVETHMESADLSAVHLEGANLLGAHLENTDFVLAHLEGAKFNMSHLQSAKFNCVFVNSSTSFIGCYIDENTDFRETALENMSIKSGTKTLLKYNIRRMNWKDWYANKRFLKWPVKLFWSISNYGISTRRIILTFFVLALFFAAVYSNLACWWDIQAIGGSGEGFTVEPHLPLWHYSTLIILRPIYFSVVTMTTLGFGDMFANAQSIWGHILLTLQVILGYVLLGALITRLAVLFTSDGPAGSFTPMDKETKELLAKLKEDKGD